MPKTVKMFPPKYIVPVGMAATLLSSLAMFKKFYSSKKYDGKEKMMAKTAIVTGANSGIGYEVAKEFAKRGAGVIMACRDMDKCNKACDKIIEETFNKRVRTKQLDLASMNSIRKFAEEVKEEEKFVDILVNNAGVMACPRTLTKDGFELQLGVNYLGPFLLTNLLMDKLKESGASRIVNVTGATFSKGKINFDDLNSEQFYGPKVAYNQSKLALMLFTRELAYRLKDSQVNSYAVHPGIVRTNIDRHTSFGQSRFSRTVLYPFTWFLSMKPEYGAQVIIHCALSPEVAKESGCYYRNNKNTAVSDNVKDRRVSQRLWDISEVWTKLKES